MKLIIGAGRFAQEGWVSTQQDMLNVLNADDWERICAGEQLEALLAEHVWEHMTYEEGLAAARNCYHYLAPGGYLRCAVPDANFRNDWYQNMAKVGGPGPADHPAYGHKMFYDYQLFRHLFEKVGFEVELLEYCDEQGIFHYRYWNESDGHVGRSLRYDTRNSLEKLGMVSIIINAYKPLLIAT